MRNIPRIWYYRIYKLKLLSRKGGFGFFFCAHELIKKKMMEDASKVFYSVFAAKGAGPDECFLLVMSDDDCRSGIRDGLKSPGWVTSSTTTADAGNIDSGVRAGRTAVGAPFCSGPRREWCRPMRETETVEAPTIPGVFPQYIQNRSEEERHWLCGLLLQAFFEERKALTFDRSSKDRCLLASYPGSYH